jgi:2-oxoisovalerate dehydrogenase E1 component
MGKETGVCGGWGGSQHLCYKRFFSNGIQGGFVPITAGLALSEELKGTKNIAACFIGEGTLGEGAVYESANLMAKWNLPALIIIENNRFSQSTPQENTISGDLLARFSAFGITTFDTDTWNLEGLYDTLSKAVNYVRGDRKPAVVRIETDRLMAHSKGDDDRPKELIESYYKRDILTNFKLENPELFESFDKEAKERIDKAVVAAEGAAMAKKPVLESSHAKKISWKPLESDEKRRVNEIIRDTFNENMAKDKRIVMIGEDILDPYGGAFKVTKGLSTAYPERVKGTTISEYALTGIGNGLSLAGMFPVCEIMFGDFMTFTLDQLLNHAAKFQFMYNHQVENPLIIRTPMGGGRGYGPTHSQSIEKHFLGIPQTIAISLNQRVSPAIIYNQLFATLKQPALVFENKTLYAKRIKSKKEEGFIAEISDEIYPTVRLRPEGKVDLTILCYGGMLELAEEAQLKLFEDYDIVAEVICPTQIYPLNINPILESVKNSGRLLIVEEGYAFSGWGSEAVTELIEAIPGSIKALKRLNMPECPIPCCGKLEKELLPNIDELISTAKGMISHE